jgi:hypothetical protein
MTGCPLAMLATTLAANELKVTTDTKLVPPST